MDKRKFLKSVFLGSSAMLLTGITSKLKAARAKRKWNGEFVLPELAFAYNALEPYIDARTMELHHARHHATYTEELNAAVKEAGLTGKTAYDLLSGISKYPPSIRINGGGYFNHKLFWKMLAPPKGQQPSSDLIKALVLNFGSFESFKEKFSASAQTIPGPGWVWLISDEGKLKITTSQNQDSPIMDIMADKGIPLLCLDVCEHAYYAKYQDKKPEYIEAFWNVINWDFVSQRFSRNRNKPAVRT